MITCNWPDFTKRTAGTENSSLLRSKRPEQIQFNRSGCTPCGPPPSQGQPPIPDPNR